MKLSIIIVTYYSEIYLRHCLESIYKNTNNIEFEIIIIDNGSQNETDISTYYPITSPNKNNHIYPTGLKLIKNKENLGFAHAVNQGIEKARGKYILCLNPDTIVLPNSLNKLVEFMDTYINAAAVGGKVLNTDGSIQFSCRKFPSYSTAFFNRRSLLTKLFKNNKLSRNYLMSDWNHDKIRTVDWVSACYLAIRKNALKKVGIFDEGFFMYCEDVDWCYRAKKAGLKVYYLPEAPIIHFLGLGGSQRHPFKTIIYQHRSIYRFYKKFYRANHIKILNVLAVSGIAIRAITLLLIRSIQITFKPYKYLRNFSLPKILRPSI
jgi:hypothetical protein